MYQASINSYDSCRDKSGSLVRLTLSDDVVASLLERLQLGGMFQVVLSQHAWDEDGQPVEALLEWQPAWSAFSCAVAGRSAGVIPLDELQGSIGKRIPKRGRTCMVCLSGFVDVWRRGVLDLDAGQVHVFTKVRELAFLGARAYLTEGVSAGLDSICIMLDKGEPAVAPLRVPSHQLHQLEVEEARLANGLVTSTSDADKAIEQLSALARQVSEFICDTKEPG